MLKRVEDGEGARFQPSVFELAVINGVSREQVQNIAEQAARWLALQLQRMTLSRGGLADVVAALDVTREQRQDAGSSQLTSLVVGSSHAAGMLAARFACRAGITIEQAEALLPAVIDAQLLAIAERARPELGELFARMPVRFEHSLGSMHADIADTVRRGAAAGPFSRAKLRRRVRAGVAEAAGFAQRGAVGWYAGQALVPVRRAGHLLRRALTKQIV